VSSEDNQAGEDGATGETSEPYRTGYRKPPRHRQFKPGQSGNPRGRPRKQRSGVQAGPLDRTIPVREAGEIKHVEPRELALRQAVKKALVDDDTTAQLYLLEEFINHGLLQEAGDLPQGGVAILSDPTMPFDLQVLLLEHYGFPPWTPAQVEHGLSHYRAQRSPIGARDDEAIGYPVLKEGNDG